MYLQPIPMIDVAMPIISTGWYHHGGLALIQATAPRKNTLTMETK